MIVGSEKKMSLIEEIINEFRESKFKFHIEKPYPELRKKSGREIRMISHNEKYQDLVKAKNKTDEENAIAFLQITKCIQIRKNYKTTNEESALKSLKSNLTNYFGKQPNEENGTIFTNLLFGSLEESLFSFVFLENCGIRTNFIKK